MKTNLLLTITIPNYIRKVTISKKRQAKYYVRGMKKIPAKYYRRIDDYGWVKYPNGKEYLVETKTGERIIANPRVVGTPSIKLINGQKIYNGEIHSFQKEVIMEAIRSQFAEYTKDIEPITDYPIRILGELHDTYIDEYTNEQDWDVDNRFYPYAKALPDVLSGWKVWHKIKKKFIWKADKIIPDDHRGYITQPPTPLFFPISNGEERKIVFKIYHDLRAEVQSGVYSVDCEGCGGRGRWTEPVVGTVICPLCKGEGKYDNRIRP